MADAIRRDDRPARRVPAWLVWTLAVVAALALRVVGVGFGDPTAHNRPDEEIYLHEALYACEGDTRFAFNNYPPAAMRWPTLWFRSLRATGIFEPSLHDYALDPMPTHVAGRWLSIVCGTLTVLLTGLLARRIAGPRAGVVAVWVAACAPMLVLHSHFAVRDAPAALLSTLALVFAVSPRDRASGLAALMLSGLACGAAAATRYPQGAFVLVPVITAGALARAWRARAAIGAAFATGFIAAAPQILDRAAAYGEGVSKAFSNQTSRRGEQSVWDALTHHLHVSFAEGVGWGAAAAACWGVVVLARRRPRALAIIAPVVVMLALHASFGGVYSRYLLGAVPILAALAGVGAAAAMEKRRRVAAILVVVAVLAPSAARSIQVDVALTRRETRGDLMRWLVKTGVPEGVIVVHPRWPFDVFPAAWSIVPAKPNRMFPAVTHPERAAIRDRVLARLHAREAEHPQPIPTYEFGPGPFDTESPYLAGPGILLVLQDVGPLFWRAVRLGWLDGVRDEIERARVDGRLLVDRVAVFEPLDGGGFPDPASFERDDYWFVPINAPFACDRPGPRIEVFWVRRP